MTELLRLNQLELADSICYGSAELRALLNWELRLSCFERRSFVKEKRYAPM